jgi:hypothetical protein
VLLCCQHYTNHKFTLGDQNRPEALCVLSVEFWNALVEVNSDIYKDMALSSFM